MSNGAQNATVFDPQDVNLDTADPTDIICYLNASGNDYDGRLGARISALFVILIVSTAGTVFPVLATRVKWFKIPLYVYLFARYFGTGVIIATAFVHLLDPSYEEIGPASCVGMTGGWATYSWPPAIAMASSLFTFLLEVVSEAYVARKFGYKHGGHGGDEARAIVTSGPMDQKEQDGSQQSPDPGNQNDTITIPRQSVKRPDNDGEETDKNEAYVMSSGLSAADRAFREQIAAFLILEFGVIFHSVIIGLNLGVAGSEFPTLYPVLVFHQTFEGLGIGSRLSVIPFPKGFGWMPWALCAAYGLTTPISIAIGLGLRTTYQPGSFTAQVVSGLLDAISAGILVYTGMVELLARDFIFNPKIAKDLKELSFNLSCLFLGAGVMALLGKWA